MGVYDSEEVSVMTCLDSDSENTEVNDDLQIFIENPKDLSDAEQRAEENDQISNISILPENEENLNDAEKRVHRMYNYEVEDDDVFNGSLRQTGDGCYYFERGTLWYYPANDPDYEDYDSNYPRWSKQFRYESEDLDEFLRITETENWDMRDNSITWRVFIKD
jgi:hypothetical protein